MSWPPGSFPGFDPNMPLHPPPGYEYPPQPPNANTAVLPIAPPSYVHHGQYLYQQPVSLPRYPAAYDSGFPPTSYPPSLPPQPPRPPVLSSQSAPSFGPQMTYPSMPTSNGNVLLQQPPVSGTLQTAGAPPLLAMPSPKPPVDYQTVLLSLANEYFAAAHGQSAQIARTRRKADREKYYELVATGLGCLESVLKNWRPDPRTEAMIRLKYARVLHEETENDLETETALGNGISLCERNRLYNLKYSMQELLVRVLHRSNPKAALKAVDEVIEEVEAYKRPYWNYTFRFLRISCLLSSSFHHDFMAAIATVKKIGALAGRQNDKAVFVLAAVTEALIHLQSSTSDSVEHAQRALATARQFQLEKEVQRVPQITILLRFIDLSCSLQALDVSQASKKADELRKVLEPLVKVTKDTSWSEDGSFRIPVGEQANYASKPPSVEEDASTSTLLFNWLPQREVYALGYLLNGIALSPWNSHDGRKAEKYLQEGGDMIKSSLKTTSNLRQSLVSAQNLRDRKAALQCQCWLQMIFLLCSRTDWVAANSVLETLRKHSLELGTASPRVVKCLIEYLQGVIYQGTGNLESALTIFRSPILALSPPNSTTGGVDSCRDTAILAALNTALIVRNKDHPQHKLMDGILDSVQPFCGTNSSKYIHAAYNLVRAASHPDHETSLKRKQYLQYAFQASKATINNQITCIALCFMSWKLFSGVVGQQAEKSSTASRQVAKRAGNGLWLSVADNLLANTLEREGKSVEAANVRSEGLKTAAELPAALQRHKMMAVQL